ncbi:MAG: hypothetical protein JNK79_00645 [Chitinophagaceae bacterium]|nr:hypothetical protein [Chitinophagaceae bacterium]
MALTIVVQACEKELSRTVKEEDQPEVSIDVSDPGDINNPGDTMVLEGISEIEKNEHSVYTFGGVRGTYFGCTSSFKGKDDQSFAITLGTNLTPHATFSQKEFELLIHTGERQYGSLGSFSSYPVIDSGLVEISFTDKNNRQWCTTQITERNSDHGTETRVKVEQKHSMFIVESIHKVEVGPETEGYRMKGYFDCTLYEVNGKARKRIKGNFTGIVAPK